MWAQMCGAHLGQVEAGGLRGVPQVHGAASKMRVLRFIAQVRQSLCSGCIFPYLVCVLVPAS